MSVHEVAVAERVTALLQYDAETHAEELLARVTELEIRSRLQVEGIAEHAEQLTLIARALGLTELALRGELIGAEMLRQQGTVAEAARIAQDIGRWATEHDSRPLRARSSFILSAVFQELGDLAMALESAVTAVDLLDDSFPPQVHVDHSVRLADCLGLNGDAAAFRRYAEILPLTQELGDVDRELMVLNNWAFCEALLGHHEAALTIGRRLETRAGVLGVPLNVGRLDTIARALIGLGRLEEAESVLLPGLRTEALDASSDGDAGADFLLTLTEVQRLLGRLPEAQESLDRCVERCERHGLTAIRVRARREEAELRAARGDHRAAFLEHKLFHEQLMQLQSDQRDARARAMHAMYETSEARRQSRRYRELSLRDPLTGLYNRRYVDEQLPGLLDPAAGTRVTIALLDLDHFKRVNDTCGHEVGDDVLRTVAALLEPVTDAGAGPTSPGSFTARMGGEEFLVVFVDAEPAAAARELDRIRQAIATHPWAGLTGTVPVTASIGATSTNGQPQPTAEELLSRADERLYRAKKHGRNRIVAD
ncbi:MAG: diguanylate cyclase [Blastococcus sp.]